MHPRQLRCSSLTYSRYARSSRLAGGAPRPSRCDARLSPRAAWLLAEMPVHQFFDELHAPEFHNLRVLFQSTIEEHADLPRSREHVRILDGGFIEEMVGARGGESLDNVQGVAVEISRAVEPGLVVETRGVDDQRFSFPVSVRPSHPAVSGRLLVFVHIDGAHRPRERVDHHDVLRALNDLEG